jgi:hypothetical protein
MLQAVIDCSQTTNINIYPTKISADEEYTSAVHITEKLANSKLILESLVTGVAIKYNFQSPEGEIDAVELYTGAVEIGTAYYSWEEAGNFPKAATVDGSAVGVTISERNEFGARVTTTVAGTLSITGFVLEDLNTTKTYDAPVGENILANIVSIESPLGYSFTQPEIIYNYYAQRYCMNFRTIAPSFRCGDIIIVAADDTLYIKGQVEKLSYDLVNGYIADVKIRGDIYALD